MNKRFLALFISICMVCTMLPATVFAAGLPGGRDSGRDSGGPGAPQEQCVCGYPQLLEQILGAEQAAHYHAPSCPLFDPAYTLPEWKNLPPYPSGTSRLLRAAIPANAQYLAFGDSIAAGFGLQNPAKEGFVALLGAKFGISATNLAVSGETSATMKARITGGTMDPALATAKYVTITVGGNDMMAKLYELIAEEYNKTVTPTITPAQVPQILGNSKDARYPGVLAAAATIMFTSTPPGELLEAANDAVANIVESAAYIRRKNPAVQIYVTNQYNPYQDVSLEFIDLGTFMAGGLGYFNQNLHLASDEGDNYRIINVANAFQWSQERPVNAAEDGTNLDFHPNAWGHFLYFDWLDSYINAKFEPVTAITGVPARGTVGTPVPLTGKVTPSNADKQTIVWSLGEGSTAPGAAVSGGVATATGAGTVVVKATVADGKGAGNNFTKSFVIVFAAPGSGVTTRTTALGLAYNYELTYAGGAGTANPAQSNILDSTEGWKWYLTAADGYAAKTLVLNGASIAVPSGSGVLLPEGATVVLAGGISQITAESAGISAWGDLRIKGGGSLFLCQDFDNGYSSSSQISADGDLTIENGNITVINSITGLGSGGDLIIEGGNINVIGANNGLSTGGDITIRGGSVAIGTVNSNGLRARDILIEGGALTVAEAETGLDARGSISIKNGSVTVSKAAEGIGAKEGISISGGRVKANGEAGGLAVREDGDSPEFGPLPITITNVQILRGGSVRSVILDGPDGSYARVSAIATGEISYNPSTYEISGVATEVEIGATTHTHKWAEAWEKNTTHHWHSCTAPGCFVTAASDKGGYATHTFSGGACTVCGYAAAPSVTRVILNPTTANVPRGSGRQFNATVIGTGGIAKTVSWQVTGGGAGTIIKDGLLTVADNESAATLTVKATSTADKTKTATATVTLTDTPVTTYGLIVLGGTGGGEYEAGNQVIITANTPAPGKVFSKWVVTGGGFLDDAASATTTFTMPEGEAWLTATYQAAPVITFHANGGAVSPASAETDTDGRLSSLPTPTRSSYRFDGWFTAATGGTAVTTQTVFTQNTTIYAHWTYTGGGGGSGSGGSGGGGGTVSTGSTETAADKPSANVDGATGGVKPTDVTKSTTEKIAATLKSGQKNPRANVVTENATLVSPQTLRDMAAAAKKAGGTARLLADTTVNGKVTGRIYLDTTLAANLKNDILLGVTVDKQATAQTAALFEKYFGVKVSVVRLAHQGPIGMRVQIAVKADPSIDTTKPIYFYTFDKKTNRYNPITNPAYTIDKNGWLYFYTSTGGDILYTNTPIV